MHVHCTCFTISLQIRLQKITLCKLMQFISLFSDGAACSVPVCQRPWSWRRIPRRIQRRVTISTKPILSDAVWYADSEYHIHFSIKGHLQGQIAVWNFMCPIFFYTDAPIRFKMVSFDSQHPNLAYANVYLNKNIWPSRSNRGLKFSVPHFFLHRCSDSIQNGLIR